MGCLVPGCTNNARNRLAIRCRKPSTLAVWAPDSDAYLCKQHAEQGVSIVVDVTPTTNKTVEVAYTSGGVQGPSRVTQIKKSAS
jgi:hypothetical protein